MKNFLIISSCLILFGVGWIEAVQVLSFADVFIPLENVVICVILFSTGLLLAFNSFIENKFVNLGMTLSILSILWIDVNSKILPNLEFEILLEHGLKTGIPILTLFFINSKISEESTKRWLKICLSFTFIGHGLYAAGLHSVPVSFINIVKYFFDCSTKESHELLLIIGIADIVVGLGYLIFPKSKILLYYLFTWTIIVTGARLMASLPGTPFLNWAGTRSPQIIWRLVHVATPFYLLRLTKNKSVY